MYFYKDINGLFRVADKVVPAGRHLLQRYENDIMVSVQAAGTYTVLINPIKVVDLKKADDSTYTDLDDLLIAVGDFFL